MPDVDQLVRTRRKPNPLEGAINRTLASGKSQDGRFLKTFLLNGFNMAGNRRAFDGMHVFCFGRGPSSDATAIGKLLDAGFQVDI